MSDLIKTPERLKQSIFIEAMKGHLTRQLPSDGNSYSLLKDIDKTKYKLLKSKQIRNYKLMSINKNDVPFKVPNNWLWVRLGRISVLNAGKNLNRYSSRINKNNKSVKYIKVADMNLSGNETEIMRSKLYINSNKKYILPTPSIIFPKIGGAIKTNKRRKVLTHDIFIDPNIMAITPINKDMFKFLWVFMNNIDLSKLQSGSAVPALNQQKINNILFPLPPLAEQHRIVQRLNEILPKVDDLNKDVVKLDQIRTKFPHRLKQSLLLEAMKGHLTQQLSSDGTADDLLQSIQQKKQHLIRSGKIRKHKKLPPISKDEIPFKIPKNWKWVRLSSIYNVICGVQLPKRIFKIHKYTGYIRYFQIRDYKQNSYPVYVPKNKVRRVSHSGDLLIARIGGSMGDIFKAYEGTSYNNNFANVTPIIRANGYKLNYYYILFYLKYYFSQPSIKYLNKSAQSYFNNRDLLRLPLAVPPMNEQNRIVTKLRNIFYKL